MKYFKVIIVVYSFVISLNYFTIFNLNMINDLHYNQQGLTLNVIPTLNVELYIYLRSTNTSTSLYSVIYLFVLWIELLVKSMPNIHSSSEWMNIIA